MAPLKPDPNLLSDDDMSFLELDRLSKAYDETLVVKGLSLSVEQGEFIALLGPSGCGKTTTLQMIAGFVEPTGGDIRLEGQSLLSVRPSGRALGIVFQSYALFPHMTAAENVAFGLEMQGVDKIECGKAGVRGAQAGGPWKFGGSLSKTYVGWTAAACRCARSRHVAVHPLDEPLSNLDAKLREEIRNRIAADPAYARDHHYFGHTRP